VALEPAPEQATGIKSRQPDASGRNETRAGGIEATPKSLPRYHSQLRHYVVKGIEKPSGSRTGIEGVKGGKER
jgi:hypothetical protein